MINLCLCHKEVEAGAAINVERMVTLPENVQIQKEVVSEPRNLDVSAGLGDDMVSVVWRKL